MNSLGITMPDRPRPMLLTILDGWGYSPHRAHNAIAQAHTPHWDDWWQNQPHTLIACSGAAVGLPQGQMGNSEVGHMHMGAGRVIEQDYTRISHAIAHGDFFKNETLLAAIKQATAQQRPIHVLALLSPGGVHSHEAHLHALLDAVHQHGGKLQIHAILDGRDVPPRSAEASLRTLCTKLKAHTDGEIVSIIGRYYAMDRDNRWQRTQCAYDLLTRGTADYHADDPLAGLAMAYARDESDEFVQATVTTKNMSVIADGDVVVCMNFRADRMRQLVRAFTEPAFDHFQRGDRLDVSERIYCFKIYLFSIFFTYSIKLD